MRPIIINNFLHSARMLGDACDKIPPLLGRRGRD
jgi:fumarate hydratase class II